MAEQLMGLGRLVTNESAGGVAVSALAILLGALAVLVSWRKGKAQAGSEKPAAEGAGDRQLTREEVAKHCSREDAWLIIDGKVYDVTEYAKEHPGGDSILRNAGGDASEGFHGPQHPPRVNDLVEDLRVGVLVD